MVKQYNPNTIQNIKKLKPNNTMEFRLLIKLI